MARTRWAAWSISSPTPTEGFKANAQNGITTYGDDYNYTFQAAAGKSFMDGRLHVVVSGEYSHENGIPAYGFGEGPGPNGRDWYETETLINTGLHTDGTPQYRNSKHAQAYQYTKYGLITAGPLQGIAFDQSGKPFNFVYGSNGVPDKNAAGTVTGCNNGFCVGGDLSGNVGNGTSLQSEITRTNGYGRIGFDIDPDNEVYATVNVARVVEQHAQSGRGQGQFAHPAMLQSVRAHLDPGSVRGQRHHQLQVWRQQRGAAQVHQRQSGAPAVPLRRRGQGQDPVPGQRPAL
jgi:hypothetical protein